MPHALLDWACFGLDSESVDGRRVQAWRRAKPDCEEFDDDGDDDDGDVDADGDDGDEDDGADDD
eukprot:5925191-Pyramimonas_sp.AAC.1